jgi:N-acetylglucosamine-6-phosphate deacetylase
MLALIYKKAYGWLHYIRKDPGIDDKTGLIGRGYEASFVVFDNEMNVIDVI